MRFAPYYEIIAWSNRVQKIQEHHLDTEMTLKKKCMDLNTAKSRAINFAASLNESKKFSATDWVGKIRVVTENGRYLLDV